MNLSKEQIQQLESHQPVISNQTLFISIPLQDAEPLLSGVEHLFTRLYAAAPISAAVPNEEEIEKILSVQLFQIQLRKTLFKKV